MRKQRLELDLMAQQIATLKAQESLAYKQAQWEARKHFIAGLAAGAAIIAAITRGFGLI